MVNRTQPGGDEAACVVADHPAATQPARPAAVSPAVRQRAAAMLSAAGDVARLGLLELLGGGELCVTDIAERTGDAMPTVSQRLRLLKREGLVAARRDGKHVYYTLADAHVRELLQNALRHAAERW